MIITTVVSFRIFKGCADNFYALLFAHLPLSPDLHLIRPTRRSPKNGPASSSRKNTRPPLEAMLTPRSRSFSSWTLHDPPRSNRPQRTSSTLFLVPHLTSDSIFLEHVRPYVSLSFLQSWTSIRIPCTQSDSSLWSFRASCASREWIPLYVGFSLVLATTQKKYLQLVFLRKRIVYVWARLGVWGRLEALHRHR